MKRIAVDLAKSVYQVAESVRSGQVVQRKRLNREAFRRYIQEQAEPVEWVMEACGTAHYWGRVAQSLGHRVKLIHARYVRPYRRRNKTDRNDCDAMLEAARCKDIYPVPVKSHEQQLLQQLQAKQSDRQDIILRHQQPQLYPVARVEAVQDSSGAQSFSARYHNVAELPCKTTGVECKVAAQAFIDYLRAKPDLWQQQREATVTLLVK